MNKDRSYSAVVKGSGSSDGPGEFDVILSTSSLDRDNEKFAAYAMDPLPDHITFDVDHERTVAGTIGSGRPEYINDGNAIRVRGKFASTKLAQMVRTLVNEGHIRSTSIHARIHDAGPDDDGIWTLRKGELLNGAFVSIPANAEAIVLAAKSLATTLEDDHTDVLDTQTAEPAGSVDMAQPEDDAPVEAADPPAVEAAESPAEAAAESEETPVDVEELKARATAFQGRRTNRTADTT